MGSWVQAHWQTGVVGLVVILALAYALWYWLPAAWRRALGRVQPGLGRQPGCGGCSESGRCPSAQGGQESMPSGSTGKPVWMKPGC